MHKLLPLFLLSFLLFACGENTPTSIAETLTPEGKPQPTTTTTTTTADPTDLARDAMATYKQDPIAALPNFIAAAKGYQNTRNNPQAASIYFTIATIYEQNVGKLDSALYYAEESLERWQVSNKTLQIANMQKYVGLLMAKNGQIDEGMDNIKVAATSYNMLDFPEGEKLAQFDLAQVHFYKKEYDKSLAFFENVQTFWKGKENNKRVFDNNIFGIELAHTMNDAKKVKALIAENKALLPKLTKAEKLKERFKAVQELVKK